MPEPCENKRSGCPISFALDLFGDRWTLLILRDLILRGKQHYREFLSSDEGIASNILSDRLKRLEIAGIVTRQADASDKRQVVYAPTQKGKDLLPVLLEIAAWGATHDAETAAPRRFAETFYQDRQSFYDDHRARFASLFDLDARTERHESEE